MSLKTQRLRRLLSLGVFAAIILGLSALAYASGGGEHHSSYTDEKFWDFIWRVMNFAVLAIVLVFILRKPLGQGLKQRTEGIKQELEELEAQREEAQREYAVLEGRLQETEAERELILDDFRAQGEREKAKIIAEAHTMAERIKATAQFTIEQETASAKAELKREITDISAALAEDMLKANINDDDQARLVDEYLERVQREA